MLKLYRFYWDCGDGDVRGLFTATQKDIDNAIGKEVYFGEVCGSHSEIYGILKEGDIKEINCPVDFPSQCNQIIGDFGYNPLDFIDDEQN